MCGCLHEGRAPLQGGRRSRLVPARGRSTRTSRVRTIALIVAAGRGERAGGGLPKQYRPLGGVSVLRRSVAAFAGHPGIESVRVVIADEHRDLYERSEEHTSELQSLMRISYAVFCLQKKTNK